MTESGVSSASETLTTRLTALTDGGITGIDHRYDATPLNEHTTTPFITFPAVPHQWFGVLVELGSTTTAGGAHFTVLDSDTGTLFVITWPDKACTSIQLSQHRKAT